ncbi:MAG: hypothetical protein R3F19_31835 [Verrucomicrobiales bacterium]
MAELDQARKLIALAIQLNPDAHFGREHFQLILLDQIRVLKAEEGQIKRDPLIAPNPDALDGYPPAEAANGIAGLIALGAAWESPDVFAALANVLAADNRTSIAHLATKRFEELVRDGKEHILPYPAPSSWQIENVAPVDAYYQEARTEADEWQAKRTAFMKALLENGMHPDTHPGFWDGFDGGDPPKLPGYRSASHWVHVNNNGIMMGLTIVGMIAAFLLVSLLVRAGLRALK